VTRSATLIGLAVVNIVTLFNDGIPGRSSAAYADQARPLEELGPAKSLTLVDPDNATDNVVLRNTAGHVAWGEQAYQQSYSMAFIHVGKPLFQLMMTEQYQEPLDDLRERLQAEGKERDEELRSVYERMQELDPQSPDMKDLQERFQQLRQQFEQWRQQAQREAAKLEAKQIMAAYDEIVAAVEVVAEQRDIDLVLRFLPMGAEDDTELQSPDQANSVIRGRTALKYPDRLDITTAVLEELALEVE